MTKLMDLMQDMARLWDKYQPLYVNGIVNTLVLALVATAIGCVIGLFCGILNTIPYTPQDNIVKRFILRLTRIIVRVYVEVFRGTPMVLQAVFIYYGLPYFTDNALRFDSVWAAAILIVSINTGAYMAESVRGGIISIDPGQTEGAKAIGMTHWQTMTNVILPQALRQQLHYQCKRHLRYVHHQLHRVLCCPSVHRRCKQYVFPLCRNRNGGLPDYDPACLFPSALGGKEDGRPRQL